MPGLEAARLLWLKHFRSSRCLLLLDALYALYEKVEHFLLCHLIRPVENDIKKEIPFVLMQPGWFRSLLKFQKNPFE